MQYSIFDRETRENQFESEYKSVKNKNKVVKSTTISNMCLYTCSKER